MIPIWLSVPPRSLVKFGMNRSEADKATLERN